MRSEFSGMPLAVGSVFGIRSWKVDALGRLCGQTYNQVWRPGENAAKCRDRDCDEIVAEDCGCGFWAYFAERERSYTEGITGVIEGYGATQLGTNGFRCAKARIIALVVADAGEDSATAEAAAIATSGGGGLAPERVAFIRRNYPDVPMYTSLLRMLSKHPVSTAADPQTPDDEGFWDVPARDLQPSRGWYTPGGLTFQPGTFSYGLPTTVPGATSALMNAFLDPSHVRTLTVAGCEDDTEDDADEDES